jgi:hypothetical protein
MTVAARFAGITTLAVDAAEGAEMAAWGAD